MHNVLNSDVWPAIPVVVVLFCEPASAKTRDLLCSNCKCYSVSCFSSFADKSTEEYNSSNTLVSFYFLYSDIGRYGGKHAETQHYCGTARARRDSSWSFPHVGSENLCPRNTGNRLNIQDSFHCEQKKKGVIEVLQRRLQ